MRTERLDNMQKNCEPLTDRQTDRQTDSLILASTTWTVWRE